MQSRNCAESSKKRSKVVNVESDDIHVKVTDIPNCNKFRFNLNDYCGAAKQFRKLLTKIRVQSSGGKKHGDIFCLTNPPVGFPFIEIELVFVDDAEFDEVKVKVLIQIRNLYFTAFHNGVEWFQLTGSGYCICTIEGTPCAYKGYDGRYTGNPWETIGPGILINAMRDLMMGEDIVTVRDACQIIIVHICEAGRFSQIENLVSNSFERATSYMEVEEDDGIYPTLKAQAIINPYLKVELDNQMKEHVEYIIKRWGRLSIYWICHHLGMYEDEKFETAGTGYYLITTPISLKASLALLNSTSKEDILGCLKRVGQERKFRIKKTIEELEKKKEL